ncbi:MAG: hypothetical protein H0T76_06795 [Nannocystis sp.]|nr:CARDB domain-containing protein [Nannocystis sp.]MBA3546170.1 hypothetical protein [Nannocystis sp.]
MAACTEEGQAVTIESNGDWTTGSGTGSPSSSSPTSTSTSTTAEPTDPGTAETGTTTPGTTSTTDEPLTTGTPDPETTGPAPSCDDGKKNGKETGVDCGGSCSACPPGPQPDLFLEYFYIDDHAMAPGQQTQLHYSIANDGKVDTEFQFYIRVVASKNDVIGDQDDIILYTYLYPYIVEAGGHSLWYDDMSIPAKVFDGAYYVGMLVDSTDIIGESNEDNNFLIDEEQLVISGNPMPTNVDLAPSTVLATEHKLLAGSKANFTFDVENLGPNAAPPYAVGLYYSTDAVITTGDALICTLGDVNGLGALSKEAQQISCDVPKLAGDYYFGVIVDPMNALAELDEDNNVAGDPALVTITGPKIDLQMGAVTSNDFTVDTGQQATLSAKVTNAGADPSPVFDVSFYLSADANITAVDKLICSTKSANALAPAAQVDVSSPCVIPAVASGLYWLGAIADAPGLIPELSEANNAGPSAIQMDVKAPDVDLQYELHFDNALLPSPGDKVTHHLQIRNNGAAASPAQFEVNVHYSSDMNITLADAKACTVKVGMVPAKTITEFQFDCTIPALAPAFYYSGVIIDPSNQVPESNEGNNWGSSPFSELIQ